VNFFIFYLAKDERENFGVRENLGCKTY